MDRSLTLKIEGGNDAMQDYTDFAFALHTAADKLRSGAFRGKIFDRNGNTVGSWNYSESPSQNESED